MTISKETLQHNGDPVLNAEIGARLQDWCPLNKAAEVERDGSGKIIPADGAKHFAVDNRKDGVLYANEVYNSAVRALGRNGKVRGMPKEVARALNMSAVNGNVVAPQSRGGR